MNSCFLSSYECPFPVPRKACDTTAWCWNKINSKNKIIFKNPEHKPMGCILWSIIAQGTARITGCHRKPTVVCPRVSPESPRRNFLCHLPDFRLLAWSVKEHNSVVWSLQICGVLSQKSQIPRQACAALLLLMLPPISFGWSPVCQISLLWRGHFSFLCCRTKPRSRLRSKAKRFYLLCQIFILKMFSW